VDRRVHGRIGRFALAAVDPDDDARRLTDVTRPLLEVQGFSDERIDELATAL
jgi:hypothetical protein